MILQRIVAPVSRLNYKYVLGELILVFVGITLSLYFDEWRTNRAHRAKERELLTHLVTSVEKDTLGLANLIVINEQVLAHVRYLLDTGRFQNQVDEKLTKSLAHINYYFTFIPDYSAYENIKHEGMNLIADQSLRIQIINYYRLIDEQKGWTETVHKAHFFEQLTPYVIDSFENYQFGYNAVPEDFEALKNDKRFWKLVRRSAMFCEVTASQMRSRKRDATDFIQNVRKYLQTK